MNESYNISNYTNAEHNVIQVTGIVISSLFFGLFAGPCIFYTYSKCLKINKKNNIINNIYIVPLYEVLTTQPYNKEEQCCICLEKFGNKTVAKLSCNHKFCESCISEWFEISVNNKCPLCREKNLFFLK
jgi:hypothetical protein